MTPLDSENPLAFCSALDGGPVRHVLRSSSSLYGSSGQARYDLALEEENQHKEGGSG